MTAKKPASDPAGVLYARAAKEPAVAELLRDVHEGLRLWRRCARTDCRRLRACCGDPAACGAQRWTVAKACLQQAKIGRAETPLARVADRQALRNPVVEPRKVIFEWRGSIPPPQV